SSNVTPMFRTNSEVAATPLDLVPFIYEGQQYFLMPLTDHACQNPSVPTFQNNLSSVGYQNFGTYEYNNEVIDLAVPTYEFPNGIGNDLSGYNLIQSQQPKPILPYNNMELFPMEHQRFEPTPTSQTAFTLLTLGTNSLHQ